MLLAPEWRPVERVAEGECCVQLVLGTELFKRRVHGNEAWDDDIIQQFQQQVQHALSERHLVRERSNGNWKVRRQSRVWIELAQPGGDQ